MIRINPIILKPYELRNACSKVSGNPNNLSETSLRNNLRATTDPTSKDNVSLGYDEGSIWINQTTGIVFICVTSDRNLAKWESITTEVNNLTSGVLPTRFDDVTKGYKKKSIWFYLPSPDIKEIYMCTDNTASHAVWTLLSRVHEVSNPGDDYLLIDGGSF